MNRCRRPAPPRHAPLDWITALRRGAVIQCAFIAVVAVIGVVLAYRQGRALTASPDVPPPAPMALAEIVPQHAAYLGITAPQPIAVTYPVNPTTSRATSAPDHGEALGLAADGIPTTALMAYQNAAAREAGLRPTCHLPWQLLAGIGRVESDHGRFAHAVLYADGLSAPPVIGIALDGQGTALIRDTDHGALDGDRVYDRAVGPMQFIPSTWARYGVDGNGDGKADPFNIFDAAAAAADYLCAAGGDLATDVGQQRAVNAYNHSSAYVRLVMSVEAIYADGAQLFTTPAGPPAPPQPPLPPVDPGPPIASPPPSSPGSSSSSSPSSSSSAAAPPSSAPSSSTSSSPGDTSSSSADSATPPDPTSPTDSSAPTDSSSSAPPPSSTSSAP